MASDPSQIIMGLLQTAGLGSTPNSVAQQNIQLRNGQQQNQIGALQIAGAQQAQQREQAYQQDTEAYFNDPRPERLAHLITKYPEQAQQIQQAHAALDAPAQQSRMTILGSIYNAARNNQPALIASQIDKIIAAEKAQGLDTAEPEALRASLAANDPSAIKQALAFSQAHLALLDPTFAKTMGIGTDQNHFSSTSDGAIYDQRDGHIGRDAPPKARKYIQVARRDSQGRVVGTQFVDAETLQPAGSEGGDPASGAPGGPSAGSVTDRIIAAESGGNPNARSPVPGQSASGLGGFTDSTWLNLYRQRFGGQGMTNAQVLALKSDPAVGREMVDAAVQDNSAALARAGLPATDTNIYTMHFLGPRGAAVLKAPADTPVNRLVPKSFIDANPTILRGKTAGQVREWAAGKMAGNPAAAQGSMPQGGQSPGSPTNGYFGPVDTPSGPDTSGLTGDDYLKTLPTGRAALIRLIAEGKQPAPRPGSRFGQQLAEDVAHYDPSADATTLPVRQKTRQEFSGNGKAAQAMGSYNRFAAHLNSLWQNHLELVGPNLGPLSGVAASIGQAFDPAHVAAYNTELEAVQGEFQKLTKLGVANEGEAQRLIHAARAAQSASGRAAAIEGMAKLVQGAYQPMHDQWSSVFPNQNLPVDLSRSSRAVLNNVIRGGTHALSTDRNGTPVAPGQQRPAAPKFRVIRVIPAGHH